MNGVDALGKCDKSKRAQKKNLHVSLSPKSTRPNATQRKGDQRHRLGNKRVFGGFFFDQKHRKDQNEGSGANKGELEKNCC